jgi:predicted transcriptional regulator
MMKYRSRDEITATILQSAAVRDGITRTKIMYNSFLSYTQLLYYLDYLCTNELLDHDRQNMKYNITAKGLEFLNAYNKMADLLKLPDLSASPSKF